ncbi:MAG: serpin family protein, partial [Deltaproteobacteria bacterium]|nr:serpin family protein [Deltaproteobacteria bacterium]
EVYHAQFGALTRDLDGDLGRPYTLNIANRLFAQDGYPLEADFLAVNEADYGAPLESLDFAGDPEGARGYINGWVADQTADMIDELLKPGVISSSTCLVLTNAIYFKASWANQFDPADTTAGTFHAPAGDVSAQMMSASVEADYAELDDLTVLSLPYEGEDLSFIALLPHDEQGLAALQASLSPETLSAWTDSAWRTEVMVQLPTFELRSSVALKDTLQGLGMIDAFDGLIADFSGIADTGLFISDVAHEAVVIVDEEGTEAAAATAVVDVGTAMPAVFTGDHPFLFIIQDNLTGSILFMGQLNDPTA